MTWADVLTFFGLSKPKSRGADNKDTIREYAPTQTASPVAGARNSTIDEQSFTLSNGKPTFKPLFETNDLEVIKWHSIYNRHISKAVSDIVSLANTEYTFKFSDEVSQRQIARMTKEIRNFEISYNGNIGFRDFVKNAFETLVYGGAMPCEMVLEGSPYPNNIRKVAILNPARIRWGYDPLTDEHIPYQKVNNIALSKEFQGLILLDKNTFVYTTIKRLAENPYGISQFLSALEDLGFDEEMITSFKKIVRNSGVMGFLSILTDRPPQKQGETQEQYFVRCLEFLRSNIVPDAEKGFSSGVMVGFKGSTEVDFQANNANYSGAEKAFDITNKRLYNAMKSHGLFFGETGAITETFARVILQIMMSLVGDYQFAIASAIQAIFKKLLLLKGFNVNHITVQFQSAMIGDTLKDAQAEAQKLANIETKLRLGLISINQAAQEAGYDSPTDIPYIFPNVQGTSQVPPLSNPRTDPSSQQSLEKKKNQYSVVLYHGADCECKSCKNGQSLQNLHFTDFDNTDLGDKYLSDKADKYFNSVGKIFDAFTKKVQAELQKSLANKRAKVTESELVQTVFAKIFAFFEQEFLEKVANLIANHVNTTYKYYREDKSIFPKQPKKDNQKNFDGFTPPEALLDFLDLRLIEYLTNADSFYLGKFITDEGLRRRMSEWIKDWYVANDGEIGDSQTLEEFVKMFGEELKELSKPMIRRIIDTTMTNTRSYAHIKYMRQAGVAKFRRVEVGDRLTCAHCNSINGKEFEVSKEINKVEKFVSQPAENIGEYAPFGTSIKLDEFEKLSESELQDLGIGCNAMHPHCRGRNVAVL